MIYKCIVVYENTRSRVQWKHYLMSMYVTLNFKESSFNVANLDINNSSSSEAKFSIVIEFDQIMSILHENEVVIPIKS